MLGGAPRDINAEDSQGNRKVAAQEALDAKDELRGDLSALLRGEHAGVERHRDAPLTGFFLFGQAYSGSPLSDISTLGPGKSATRTSMLQTAMAISGAAAAPQMGLATTKRFRFWLALLNVVLAIVRPDVRRLTLGAPGLEFPGFSGDRLGAACEPPRIAGDQTGCFSQP